MLDYKVCSECSKKIPWGPDDECLKEFVRCFEDDETNSLEWLRNY
jgi:hypothetical protein